MSLQDDLRRNRRVFSLLTGPPDDMDTPSAPSRQNTRASEPLEEAYRAEPFQAFDAETHETARQNVYPQQDAPQKIESFSLAYGQRTSRETGMALRPLSLEDVAFPELRQADTPTASDPLEDFYHRLESEARRASQLLGEEEY